MLSPPKSQHELCRVCILLRSVDAEFEPGEANIPTLIAQNGRWRANKISQSKDFLHSPAERARALPFAEPNSVIAEAKQEHPLLVQGKAYLYLLAPVIRCWPSEVTVRSAVSAMTNSYLVCSQLATLSGLQVSRLSLEPAERLSLERAERGRRP